jgi:ferredoxin-type protein NapH
MPDKTAVSGSTGRAILLTIPMLLWTLLMFSRVLVVPRTADRVAAIITAAFMVTLFFLMLRTQKTHRWRRFFFVALGFLFPVGFIWDLIALRGSMSIPIEQMVAGNTPFCFMVIPLIIIPAALTKTIIFPGSILPTSSNPNAIGAMIGLWLAGTLVLGKGWCSYGCFFGGIEEGFAAVRKKALIRNIDPKYRLVPWAVLVAVVLLSAATFEPVYCSWLCPFKTVTEYPQIRSLETAAQAGIFLSLFLGLVVVLPVLTKKRAQCTYFCSFGAFQSLFNKTSAVDIRIRRDLCLDCVICRRDCPTASLSEESRNTGKPLLSCMKCGACVDACPKNAAVWHVKGTPVGASPERARLLHLYASWAFATMFGGSIIAGALAKLLGFLG